MNVIVYDVNVGFYVLFVSPVLCVMATVKSTLCWMDILEKAFTLMCKQKAVIL